MVPIYNLSLGYYFLGLSNWLLCAYSIFGSGFVPRKTSDWFNMYPYQSTSSIHEILRQMPSCLTSTQHLGTKSPWEGISAWVTVLTAVRRPSSVFAILNLCMLPSSTMPPVDMFSLPNACQQILNKYDGYILLVTSIFEHAFWGPPLNDTHIYIVISFYM